MGWLGEMYMVAVWDGWVIKVELGRVDRVGGIGARERSETDEGGGDQRSEEAHWSGPGSYRGVRGVTGDQEIEGCRCTVCLRAPSLVSPLQPSREWNGGEQRHTCTNPRPKAAAMSPGTTESMPCVMWVSRGCCDVNLSVHRQRRRGGKAPTRSLGRQAGRPVGHTDRSHRLTRPPVCACYKTWRGIDGWMHRRQQHGPLGTTTSTKLKSTTNTPTNTNGLEEASSLDEVAALHAHFLSELDAQCGRGGGGGGTQKHFWAAILRVLDQAVRFCSAHKGAAEAAEALASTTSGAGGIGSTGGGGGLTSRPQVMLQEQLNSSRRVMADAAAQFRQLLMYLVGTWWDGGR
eukprot:364561-Chlamydomonas_euryale.AAC.6